MATRRLIPALLGAALLAIAEGDARAQTDPRLVAIVQLAQDGHADSARAAVRRLLEATAPSDSTYGEIVYTSGVVAATEYERRLALRRVVVEYAASPWADDALLLMGQVDYAGGNPGSALAQFARLIADYPGSPLTALAAFWGARAASDLRNGAEACRLADLGLAAGTDDVELKNQLQYERQRCGALLAATPPPADTTPKPVPPAPAPDSGKRAAPAPARPAARGGFRVQVIAAPTRARADQSVASLRPLGLEAVIVEEGGFFKVRAGPFPTRAAADSARIRIRNRLGGQPFIVAGQ